MKKPIVDMSKLKTESNYIEICCRKIAGWFQSKEDGGYENIILISWPNQVKAQNLVNSFEDAETLFAFMVKEGIN